MSIDVTSNDTLEAALRAIGLAPGEQQEIRSRFDTESTRASRGFHGPLDIDTLVGLPGTYLWTEEPTGVRTITFTFDAATVGFQGTYLIKTGVLVVEQGVFHSIPNNPAIGFAFIGLVPQGGAARAFVINSMFTDDTTGKIINLQLQRFAPTSPFPPFFSAVRISG